MQEAIEEAVEPQNEPIDEILEEAPEAASDFQEEAQNQVEDSPPQKTMIPLSALQKEREKRRELELEIQWMKQREAQAQQKPPEEDNSRYESATKEDLLNAQAENMRLLEERLWIKANREKYEYVNANLKTFLDQRPNLASAIHQSSNRYEEAYELMDKLIPKAQSTPRSQATPRKEAPNSPGGIPKAAALKESVDVMNMSDSEFRAWRDSKKRGR